MASSLFEIGAGDPARRPRIVLWSVCGLVGVLFVWACLAQLDIVAVAQGRLVPRSYVKIVQPAEAGIVREILIEEGDRVERGQVLVRLDPTVNAADSTAIARELELHRLELRRIEAELADEPMQTNHGDRQLLAHVKAKYASRRRSFRDSLAQEGAARERSFQELQAATELQEKLASTLPSYQRSAEAHAKLASQNLIGALQAEERRRDAMERAQDLAAQRATVAALKAALSQHDRRLEQVLSTYVSELNDARLETGAAINRLEQHFGKLQYQQGLLELRAPQAGIVKELATTTVGAVVQPGTVLLSLVPQNEPLLAEVLIENKDIGFVVLEQRVRVKLAAYPFQKYGMLEGVVKTVSADSISAAASAASHSARNDERQGDLVFKALIDLKDQRLNNRDLALPLAAGMQVSAEIMQGKRTVLEYLLSPVKRVVSEAGMER